MARKPHFHIPHQFAIGTPCIRKCSMDLPLGAANGARGIITNYTCHDPTHSMVSMLKQLSTQLDTGDTIPVLSASNSSCSHAEGRFNSTFSVGLVYAMAGHASQGLAIPGPFLIDIANASAADGQARAYVVVPARAACFCHRRSPVPTPLVFCLLMSARPHCSCPHASQRLPDCPARSLGSTVWAATRPSWWRASCAMAARW
eukprot:365621-Chlamydomonas_euryale.AAC.17